MELTPRNANSTERLESEDDLPRLGQWYWVKSRHHRDIPESGVKEGDDFEWLGCVMGVGSNYVSIEAPHGRNGSNRKRVHVDQFEELRYEPHADDHIARQVALHQANVNELIREVGEVTRSLGLQDTAAITNNPSDGESRAIATLSGQDDVRTYESALVRAKEEILPALFKRIEYEHQELATWMTAKTMPLQAQISPLKSSIEEINNRIFSVSLYAGLAEEAVQCSDGAPASITERLRVLQRLAFMDEECLAGYEAGGMDINDISQFDEWIAKPDNRDRILPFPRCMVALQVRRKEKEREYLDARSTQINIQLARADKLTFLFVRNGEQVWRISCEMDFGSLIFPDKADFDPAEPMMLKTFANSVDKMMPVREYEWRLEQYEEAEALSKKWAAENPGESWVRNPYGGGVGDYVHPKGDRSFNPRDWKRLDFSNVHYDEAMDLVTRKVREYNRIALIIQGLFDRSPVLHPHAPVRSWTQEGFNQAIELIYDGTMTLYEGEEPDFEAYRNRLNATMGVGSVVTGQEEHWLKSEAAKENRKIRENNRVRDKYQYKRYRPSGNPGPGNTCVITEWKPRNRQAVFRWLRENVSDLGMSDCSMTVPVGALLNISAYRPGDFKQFFRDPRTRAKYLQWAPLLLAAEDYHAGKISLRDRRQIEAAMVAGITAR